MGTLSENGFALLGASPADDRRTLTEKADEAALLGGEDIETAFHQLLQMNRRIPAELSWFPGSTRDTAAAFLEYSRRTAEGKPAVIPPMEGLGTALAQANGLLAFFDIWPADDPDLFLALCRSIDKILGRVRAEEILEAVNADRTAGRWDIIHDVREMEEPLDMRLRELCGPAVRAAGKLDTTTLSSAIHRLFQTEGFDGQGNVAQTLASVYEIRIHEKETKLKTGIETEIKQISAKISQSANLSAGADYLGLGNNVANIQKALAARNYTADEEFKNLQEAVDAWCDLTAPLRQVPGTARTDARKIGFDIRNSIVDYVNKAPKTRKEKTFHIHEILGNDKKITISYDTKRKHAEKALELTAWLETAFPEQMDLLEKLREDKESLENMIRNEEEMLKKAEKEQRDKHRLSF